MNVAAQRGVIRCRPLRVRCGPAWAAEHETPLIPRRKSEPRPITGQLPAGPRRCWLARMSGCRSGGDTTEVGAAVGSDRISNRRPLPHVVGEGGAIAPKG